MSGFVYSPHTVGVIKRHARTMAPETIAILMQCSVGTIEVICRKHGIDMRERDVEEPPAKIDERKFKKSKLDISIDDLTLAAVNIEARRRGMSPRELAARLIESIVDGHIFSAVLDR